MILLTVEEIKTLYGKYERTHSARNVSFFL